MSLGVSNSIHELAELEVGNLVLSVSPPSERRTLELSIERDASLQLKAPKGTSIERATKFVNNKRGWVFKKLAERDALFGPPIAKQFVEGEGFAYLGRSYRLSLSHQVSDIRLERGRFKMNSELVAQGADVMRRWYVATGKQWLRKRIRPWASRAGEGEIELAIRDLGFRWGSARRSAEGRKRINVHWAVLQLPPSLIDYILVHEIAHLREANHTPEYWAIVARLMPGYESHKSALATYGKNVWLGSIVP